MNAPYRWEIDWPRIGWERVEIGRDDSDGIISRPIYAEQLYFYQRDPATERVEITRDEYDRISAEWDAKRNASAETGTEQPQPEATE